MDASPIFTVANASSWLGQGCFCSPRPCAALPGACCRWCCSGDCKGRAGAIQPIAITIIGDIYRPTERARIQGYISGVFGVAAIIGPMLGAFLVQHVTWSLVFWINLPIGALTFLMFGLFLHESRVPRRHRIDYLGSGLMMFGAGALMLALVQVGNSGGMATIAALAASGVVALLALAAHERGAAEPILPLKLWRDRVIAVGSLSGFTGGMVMMAINAFLPLYVQGAMGRSPAAAGLALGAASVSWTFASVAAGRLMIRTSYRLAATVGGAFLIAGTLVLSTLSPASGLLWAGTGSLLIGTGMGFCNTAFLVSTQASVGWNERGMATSSIMFMRIVGNSVGAAVFGAVLNFGINRRIPEAGDAVNHLLEQRRATTSAPPRSPGSARRSPAHCTSSMSLPASSRSSAFSWHWHCRQGSARRVRSHGLEETLYPEIARRSL